MYRANIERLNQWKNNPNRQPLILLGARQVGKTWFLKEFGQKYFDNVCYVNFEQPGELTDLFEGTIDIERLIDYLGAYSGHKIQKQNTLIIFDEVQQIPRALTSLKYFAEEAPEYAICCACSLLGVALHEGTSFPVGKVDFMTLQPLSFREFLLAIGEEQTLEYVNKYYDKGLPQTMIERMVDCLKIYFIVGGMPKAVDEWVKKRDYNRVSKIQEDILQAYQNDFSKHAPKSIVPKLHHVWDSIPSQLAKENKKFVYGVVREGARAREYENALLWLRDSGLIRRVGLVSGARLPLKAYEDLKSFKIYHLDIGLFRCMCEIPPSVILGENRIFSEYKGSLTEQFVLQELQCLDIIKSLYYWSEGATSEVDFIFSYNDLVIPCEAKAGLNVRAQSLKVFMNKYAPQIALRTSLKNFRKDASLLNVPLYELWLLPNILEANGETTKG
ncbi:MAG: ATP-binding protein [Bacteroidales bacterium]|nr:ATP-binding protein [Bacteroidales bacterium]